MPDGAVLLADRWAPRTGGDSLPLALLRSPYGRGKLISLDMVRPLAERGFQVLLSDHSRHTPQRRRCGSQS
jgi:predicted acyl esterase